LGCSGASGQPHSQVAHGVWQQGERSEANQSWIRKHKPRCSQEQEHGGAAWVTGATWVGTTAARGLVTGIEVGLGLVLLTVVALVRFTRAALLWYLGGSEVVTWPAMQAAAMSMRVFTLILLNYAFQPFLLGMML